MVWVRGAVRPAAASAPFRGGFSPFAALCPGVGFPPIPAPPPACHRASHGPPSGARGYLERHPWTGAPVGPKGHPEGHSWVLLEAPCGAPVSTTWDTQRGPRGDHLEHQKAYPEGHPWASPGAPKGHPERHHLEHQEGHPWAPIGVPGGAPTRVTHRHRTGDPVGHPWASPGPPIPAGGGIPGGGGRKQQIPNPDYKNNRTKQTNKNKEKNHPETKQNRTKQNKIKKPKHHETRHIYIYEILYIYIYSFAI